MRTLSSLIGRDVVTRSGFKLGRCHDIKAELTQNRLEVIALCIGRAGYLARLGIRSNSDEEVEWSSVIRIEGKRIVVLDPNNSSPQTVRLSQDQAPSEPSET